MILECAPQVELDSNMTEDEWWHGNFQKDEKFECFSTQLQLRSQFCLLAVPCSRQGYWREFRADIGTLFFLDKIQTKHSQTHLHKEESLFFVKGMLVAPLSTAGVSDELAQELQMPMGPQTLEDVEEPMLARPATLRDPCTPDQIVMEQHSLTHILRVSPGARCASNPEDTIHHISLTTDTWVTEAPCTSRASWWEQTLLLETSTRRWCPTPRRWTCPYVVAATAKWVRDMGYERFCLHGDTRRSSSVATGQSGKRIVVQKDKTGKFYNKCHRHRAIRAVEHQRKPSPQCVD